MNHLVPCPKCASRDTWLLATQNEWDGYCPKCDIRYSKPGVVYCPTPPVMGSNPDPKDLCVRHCFHDGDVVRPVGLCEQERQGICCFCCATRWVPELLPQVITMDKSHGPYWVGRTRS